ncbi:MAG: DUF1659 domain-containing protein [Phascolarctobacterium sp.]|jgi:hypothetical protein|nr:DUF1659 domain-containing protein [Phascolarctobacterium sp.]MBQ3114325.1 DUF1659 domain-containing protein [Phascolarctobacterium sp.]MBQ8691343.1 DUF1659 domain-containing protein [Phascolarctobacterium sp.]MBR1976253.1 DUF1659 domain-containing protein [Phascolarctobacterium sp.]MBR2071777.1 DUF1659 domain-containing protein [Phascolarctobacterium sp.]
MTINQQLIKRSLVINVEDGVNADGSTRTKSRTYSEIKEDSQVDKLFEAGNALAGLMANNMVNIMLNDRSELVEE